MPAAELRSPTFEDVLAAQQNLRGHAVVTPLLESPELNAMAGGRLLCKAEALQRTGSYKFRGAFNRLSQLDAAARQRGIVAFSTGNFGQAVAAAAKLLNIPATVIIPQDAPAIKVENTRSHGAEVLFYDRANHTQRADMARELSGKRGLTIVPPGDDPLVIAGYGTSGLELLDQHPEPVDSLLCPCGGGGLSAGIALAFSGRQPRTRIFTVEPEGYDDTARSLAAGQRLSIEGAPKSICDAIQTPIPAELPFRTLREKISGSYVMKDADVRRAMALAFRHLKLVLEPSGAIALSAALFGGHDCKGKTVALICSGGSVDPVLYASVITEQY